MAFVQLAEGELHYQLEGPADAPVLVLSNSLGTDLHMWDIQIPAFTEHFRVLRFDTRGHGQSLVTAGPYSIEQLGRDVIALLDALKMLSIPVIECHLSNPAAREEFRRHTFVSLAATGIVSGFGAASYELAIEAALGLIRA